MSVQEQNLPPRNEGAAEPAPAKAGPREFRPDIQGLRALAVGMVVIYHLYPALLPGGFAGVDVFFVISGFLITGHLLREYDKTGRVRLVEFWGRRAKRLIPAAAVVLTATWIAARIVLPSTRLAETAVEIRASALYYENWQLAWNAVDYLKAGAAASPVQHFWSLSVEEQFYLGWPLLFLLAALAIRLVPRIAGKRVPGRYVILALAAAVVVASLSYSVYYTNVNPEGAYFVTTTRIWELGLGGLLALLPAAVAKKLERLGIIGWAGLALVIASAFVLSGTLAFPGALALLPAGGAALLILGGSAAGRRGPSRLTQARPLVFVGGISYSLYLWHWPMIVLWTAWSRHPVGPVSGPCIIVAAVAVSWLSKTWIEDRVRTAKLLSGPSGWRSVSTALAAVVPVALVSAWIVAQPAPWNGHLGPDYPGAAMLANKVTQVQPEPVLPPPASIALPAYWSQGCLVATTSPTPKQCVYGDTRHPKAVVALVGDSMAGDWFTPLLSIARQRHWELITDLHSVCPFSATLTVETTGDRYNSCYQWGVTVLHDLITKIRPTVVITSDYPGLGTVDHPGGGPRAQAEIGQGMAEYWAKLRQHGIGVIAVKESPLMSVDIPTCVAENQQKTSRCDELRSKVVKPQDLPTVYADQDTSSTTPLIDMDSLICGPVKCPAVVGNVLVYQDNHHLTSVYAQTTAPYLEQRLVQVSKKLART